MEARDRLYTDRSHDVYKLDQIDRPLAPFNPRDESLIGMKSSGKLTLADPRLFAHFSD